MSHPTDLNDLRSEIIAAELPATDIADAREAFVPFVEKIQSMAAEIEGGTDVADRRAILVSRFMATNVESGLFGDSPDPEVIAFMGFMAREVVFKQDVQNLSLRKPT